MNVFRESDKFMCITLSRNFQDFIIPIVYTHINKTESNLEFKVLSMTDSRENFDDTSQAV